MGAKRLANDYVSYSADVFFFAFISSSLVSLKSSFKHGFQHAFFHRLKIYKMEWMEENQQKKRIYSN